MNGSFLREACSSFKRRWRKSCWILQIRTLNFRLLLHWKIGRINSVLLYHHLIRGLLWLYLTSQKQVKIWGLIDNWESKHFCMELWLLVVAPSWIYIFTIPRSRQLVQCRSKNGSFLDRHLPFPFLTRQLLLFSQGLFYLLIIELIAEALDPDRSGWTILARSAMPPSFVVAARAEFAFFIQYFARLEALTAGLWCIFQLAVMVVCCRGGGWIALGRPALPPSLLVAARAELSFFIHYLARQ